MENGEERKAKEGSFHAEFKDKIHMAQFQGMMMPEVFEPIATHVQKVADLKLREDDIMLCTYPKSGINA